MPFPALISGCEVELQVKKGRIFLLLGIVNLEVRQVLAWPPMKRMLLSELALRI